MTIWEIHPVNPDQRKINQVVQAIETGQIGIFPTDSVYGLACLANNRHGIERICQIKHVKPEKELFSLLCRDIQQVSAFTRQIDNAIFRVIRRHVPGPYTFILNANSELPKIIKNRKGTIGMRVPNNAILQAILAQLSLPLITTSVKQNVDEDWDTYYVDPYDLRMDYEHVVDFMVDGGPGNAEASTVLDCTGDAIQVIRQGIGVLDL
ncbi:MAG TPA: L-threonylcarbamoyladenylate synthase [Saprospiraceae bacterium]|nr:threonylcarbamoyl-AMP synthase [Lewinellaceae bacterium]HPQ98968.1 L-threonylcarbamoyladenylate synthase [Saprospiraceae bacterium]HRV85640.1 L-threonylcarbamoyladenylate synthase [Saprospiraceae bacterium]